MPKLRFFRLLASLSLLSVWARNKFPSSLSTKLFLFRLIFFILLPFSTALANICLSFHSERVLRREYYKPWPRNTHRICLEPLQDLGWMTLTCLIQLSDNKTAKPDFRMLRENDNKKIYGGNALPCCSLHCVRNMMFLLQKIFCNFHFSLFCSVLSFPPRDRKETCAKIGEPLCWLQFMGTLQGNS